MNPKRCRYCHAVVAAALLTAVNDVPTAADVVFPRDSGVVNVNGYGALPDDGADDTAAIQRALDEHPSGNHVFYFPAGTYLITETLRPARDDGVTKRNIFQGQDRQRTILKLVDDLDHRDAVIDYRSGPAQFFRNAVRNLTIDIGRGNPNSSGLKFNASNQGTVSHVTIRSADRSGQVGLDLRHSDEVGPLLVRNVEIVGFQVGIGDGPDPVIIERLQGGGITYEHAGQRTAVFRHLLGWTYHAAHPRSGDVFVDDVVGAPVVFKEQHVWARQLDIEGDIEDRPEVKAKLVNDGGDVWILGFKAEEDGTHIVTRNGGRTELLGALHVGTATRGPRYVTENASFSAALVNGGTDRVRETRGDETRDGKISHADLYTAFAIVGDDVVYLDNADTDRVRAAGNWESVASPPGGFVGHDLLRAQPDSGARVRFIPEIPQTGRYAVDLRWINQISSLIRYGKQVPIEVIYAGGRETLTVNQRRHGGKWNRIGTFRFTPDDKAEIIVKTESAGCHVQADAIRLRRLSQIE